MPNAIDLTGQVFGRLTVLEATLMRANGQVLWRCICSCSERTECFVRAHNLRRQTTQSCGCLKSENLAKGRVSRKRNCPYSIRRIEELYKGGLSITDIAKQTHVQTKAVKRWLSEAGVTLRNKSDVDRIRWRKYRPALLKGVYKAHAKIAEMRNTGHHKSSGYLHTGQITRKRLKSFHKTIAVRRARQQAEREQSVAINRALNGDTFH